MMFLAFTALTLAAGLLWPYLASTLRRAGGGREPAARPDLRAAAILCVRGADPFLAACVRGLLLQDYPELDVYIVVDSRDDPAWRVIQEVQADLRRPRVMVSTLTDRRPSCSLKCSAILQALSKIEECDVVAFLDSDTIPGPNWLRDLTAPLSDPEIGATTGNRWYAPPAGSWAAHLRAVWNAGAVTHMFAGGLIWGGSFCVRRDLLRDPELLRVWGTSLTEDLTLSEHLSARGVRTVFLPHLVIRNDEDCTLGSFFRWMTRQLLLVRLYHRSWRPISLQCLASALGFGGVLFAGAIGGDEPGQPGIGLGFAVIAAYLFCYLLVIRIVEVAARHAEPESTPTVWSRPLTLLAVPVVGLVFYPLGMIRALAMRRVEWRGALYALDTSKNVRLTEDPPFIPEASSPKFGHSL